MTAMHEQQIQSKKIKKSDRSVVCLYAVSKKGFSAVRNCASQGKKKKLKKNTNKTKRIQFCVTLRYRLQIVWVFFRRMF